MRQDPSKYSPQCPGVCGVFHGADENRQYSCKNATSVPSHSRMGVLLPPAGGFLMWLVLSWKLQEKPLGFLVLCPPHSGCLGLPEFSVVCPQPRESASLAQFPPSCGVARNPLPGNKLRQLHGWLCFSTLRNYCLSLFDIKHLKTIALYTLPGF